MSSSWCRLRTRMHMSEHVPHSCHGLTRHPYAGFSSSTCSCVQLRGRAVHVYVRARIHVCMCVCERARVGILLSSSSRLYHPQNWLAHHVLNAHNYFLRGLEHWPPMSMVTEIRARSLGRPCNRIQLHPLRRQAMKDAVKGEGVGDINWLQWA